MDVREKAGATLLERVDDSPSPPPPTFARPDFRAETRRELLWMTVSLVGIIALVWFLTIGRHTMTSTSSGRPAWSPTYGPVESAATSEVGATSTDVAATNPVAGGATTLTGVATSPGGSAPSPAAAGQVQGVAASPAGNRVVAVPVAAAPPPTGSDLFVADVENTPGFHTTMPYAAVVTAGLTLCAAIPGVPNHAALVTLLGRAQFESRQVEVFLTAAERDLCPQTRYGGGVTPAAPARAPAPVAGGAPAGIPPGIYRVGDGAGEVEPGFYRAPGPYAAQAFCGYQRLQDDRGAVGAVLAGNGSTGPTAMTVQETDGFVVVVGCTFTRD